MDKEKQTFKDTQGRYLTMALFAETNTTASFKPLYTLKEESVNGLPSAYEIYMNAVDEYAAIMELVGSVRHWEKLCATKWFMEGQEHLGFSGLHKWRLDKEAKEKSEMKNILKKLASEGNVQAAKILYNGDKKETRGRPKKADIAKAASKKVETDLETKLMLERFNRINKQG